MPTQEELLAKLRALEKEENSYQAKNVSGIESILRSGGQGITGGLSDEAAGAIDYIASGFEPGSYTEGRDESRRRNDIAQEAHPWLYGAGEVAGGAALAGLTGGAGGVARGVALGAGMGLGHSEADLTEGEYGQAALDTAVGAGVGGVMGKILPSAASPVAATKNLAPVTNSSGGTSTMLRDVLARKAAATASGGGDAVSGAAEKYIPKAAGWAVDQIPGLPFKRRIADWTERESRKLISKMNPSEVISKVKNSKFAGQLTGAVKNGTFPAVYYILQQTDPEFRKAVEENE